MKKSIFIVLAIVLIRSVIYGAYCVFFKRTPENLIKWAFNISLKDFDYRIDTFDEQWCPNGDGKTLIIVKFNKLTQLNIDYLNRLNLKSLPVTEEDRNLMDFAPKKCFESNRGFYIYKALSDSDKYDYQVFFIDTINKIAIYYTQIM
jgi:hypothetical protein